MGGCEGAVRVEIYFVTITVDQTAGKERYLLRETFRLSHFSPLAPMLQNTADVWGKKVTDIGYARNWI